MDAAHGSGVRRDRQPTTGSRSSTPAGNSSRPGAGACPTAATPTRSARAGAARASTGSGPGSSTLRSGSPPTALTSTWRTSTTSASRSSTSPVARVAEWPIPGGQRPERADRRRRQGLRHHASNAMWRFDTNGVPDNSWDGDGVTGSPARAPDSSNWPEGVAVGRHRRLRGGQQKPPHREVRSERRRSRQAGASAAADDGQFNFPYGVLATGGSVWVADTYNHRLQKFSQAGAHQLTVGARSARRLLLPGRRQRDSLRGRVRGGLEWARHPAARRLGQHRSRGGSTEASSPASVTVTANGMYAPAACDHVNLYDTDREPDGPVRRLGLRLPASSASRAGARRTPTATCTSPTSPITASQKFSPAGAPLAAVRIARDRATGSSTRPGTWPSTAGNVYVADSANNRIQKFARNGAFLAKWGSYGGGDGQFENPTGVTVDSRGHVFVSDGAAQPYPGARHGRQLHREVGRAWRRTG